LKLKGLLWLLAFCRKEVRQSGSDAVSGCCSVIDRALLALALLGKAVRDWCSEKVRSDQLHLQGGRCSDNFIFEETNLHRI